MIERGSELDWFQSRQISFLAIASLVGIGLFVHRGLSLGSRNIVDFSSLKDRNFSLCNLIMAIYCGASFGIIMLQPLVLQVLLNYPAAKAGMTFGLRGVSSGTVMMMIGIFAHRLNLKIVALIGILMMALGNFLLSFHSIETHMATALQIPNILQGLGLGMFFVPMTSIAFAKSCGRAGSRSLRDL